MDNNILEPRSCTWYLQVTRIFFYRIQETLFFARIWVNILSHRTEKLWNQWRNIFPIFFFSFEKYIPNTWLLMMVNWKQIWISKSEFWPKNKQIKNKKDIQNPKKKKDNILFSAVVDQVSIWVIVVYRSTDTVTFWCVESAWMLLWLEQKVKTVNWIVKGTMVDNSEN